MPVDEDALRRGDPATFEAIYKEHLEVVMRMLQLGFSYYAGGERRFFRVASAFDREELCQEAFCVFFQQCQRGIFDASRPIRPYLRRIVVNLAMGNARRLYREVTLAEPLDDADAYTPPDPLERSEVVGLMREFRAELPEEELAVVKLYFEGKRSQKAVGADLGLSRDQVYRRIGRIRAAALKFLKQRGWLDDP